MTLKLVLCTLQMLAVSLIEATRSSSSRRHSPRPGPLPRPHPHPPPPSPSLPCPMECSLNGLCTATSTTALYDEGHGRWFMWATDLEGHCGM